MAEREQGGAEAEAVEVRDNREDSRFEADVGGAVAYAAYERDGDQIRFTHTKVPKELEGRGIGSALARKALETARAEGLEVEPVCPFIRSWIERHPEYEDLLAS